jgi:hypothetical protein
MPDQKQSILLGALVTALLSTSYLGFINCLCCAGVIIGGLVTVWHYTGTYQITIPAGKGAVMGLLAAILGAVIATILNYFLAEMGLGANEAIMNFFIENFGENMPPEQLEQMREQMEQNQSLGAYLLNGLVGVLVSAIFGAIGGAIGAAIFQKGEDGSASGEMPAGGTV